MKKFDISRLTGKSTFDPERVEYEDSIDVIGNEWQNTRKSFVKIGWHLKHVSEKGTFRKEGYGDIYELAYAKFKMSEGTVNRMINICIQYSVNHDSPELDERYQEFDSSQLFEMLPMKEEEREKISPDMTVKQIREQKAKNKAGKEPSEKLVERFFCHECINLSEFPSVSELKEFLIDRFGKSKACGGPPNFKCSSRGISLDNYPEMTWLAFAKKAWNLKESNSPEKQEAHNTESQGALADLDPSGSSGSEGMSDMIVPGKAVALAQVDVSDEKATASEEDAVAEKPDQAALLEEARSLSWQLYDGFRFSTQNHILSQIEDYKKYASKLNDIVHALHDQSASE